MEICVYAGDMCVCSIRTYRYFRRVSTEGLDTEPSTSVVLSIGCSPTVGTRASLRNSGFQGCSREHRQDEPRRNHDSRSKEIVFH